MTENRTKWIESRRKSGGRPIEVAENWLGRMEGGGEKHLSEVWGSPGNFQRHLGNFQGTSVKFHNERTSGEVARELLGTGTSQKLGGA